MQRRPLYAPIIAFGAALFFILAACSPFKDPALLQIDQFIAEQNIDKLKSGWKTKLNKPPRLSFPEDTKYLWELETNKGNITIELYAENAPMHVSSTIYLTRLGFYDSTIFHRVIPSFMAQGGDPLGIGSGNPGYKYDGEFELGLSHDRPGLLSMANAGPGTDGSQFFITFAPTPFLDGKHTLFGEVISGMETLGALESAGSQSGKTSEELKLIRASILVN